LADPGRPGVGAVSEQTCQEPMSHNTIHEDRP
jgi:hypothetical protein